MKRIILFAVILLIGLNAKAECDGNDMKEWVDTRDRSIKAIEKHFDKRIEYIHHMMLKVPAKYQTVEDFRFWFYRLYEILDEAREFKKESLEDVWTSEEMLHKCNL
jgi:hypothetical protein